MRFHGVCSKETESMSVNLCDFCRLWIPCDQFIRIQKSCSGGPHEKTSHHYISCFCFRSPYIAVAGDYDSGVKATPILKTTTTTGNYPAKYLNTERPEKSSPALKRVGTAILFPFTPICRKVVSGIFRGLRNVKKLWTGRAIFP